MDPEAPAARSRLAAPALLALVVVVTLAPFLGKAVHIDDPMYLWAARHIQAHPLDFYGFDVNWYGHVTSMAETNKNPPLVSYYLAAAALAGWSEPALHAAMMLPAVLLVLAIYALAKGLCRHPLPAALTAWTMPAVLVSATTLMSDIPMLALWCGALALWLRGLERGRPAALWGAAALAGAAILTKYFALSLIPLFVVTGWLARRRAGAWLAPLALPVLVVAAYQAWMRARYGIDPLADVASYALHFRAGAGVRWLEQGTVALLFLGGGLLSVLGYAPWLFRREALLGDAALLAALAITFGVFGLVGSQPLPEPGLLRWALAGQAALFLAGGLLAATLAVADLRRRRDPGSVLLALWLAGVFGFAGFANWTTSARAILPAAPAVAILVWRALEDHPRLSGTLAEGRVPAQLLVPLAPALAVALAVAWGDARLAGSAREAARTLVARYAPLARTVWFQGAWGFQYYMEAQGARRIAFGETVLEPGDVAVVPHSNSNVVPLRTRVRRLTTGSFPAARFVTTLSRPLRAGFYTDRWGPLPYAFGPVPPEHYEVYGVTGTLRLEKRPGEPGPGEPATP